MHIGYENGPRITAGDCSSLNALAGTGLPVPSGAALSRPVVVSTPPSVENLETRRTVGSRSRDSRAQSVVKSITYRLLGSATTALLVFQFGGHSVRLSASAGAAEAILKMVLYFVHERIWSYIDIGLFERGRS